MRNKIVRAYPFVTVIRGGPPAMVLTVLLAVLGLVVACGGAASNGPTARSVGMARSVGSAAANTISIKNFTFMPASLTVTPGTKITVINEDQATHTLTARDKSFDTGQISGGQRAEFTAPSKPGSYPYLCMIHQYMSGTLIVQ